MLRRGWSLPDRKSEYQDDGKTCRDGKILEAVEGEKYDKHAACEPKKPCIWMTRKKGCTSQNETNANCVADSHCNS